MKTVILERKPILIVDDTALLILNIAVSIGNFTVEGLIKEAHKFMHKSLVEEENYLGSNSTENLLIPYLIILTRRKEK